MRNWLSRNHLCLAVLVAGAALCDSSPSSAADLVPPASQQFAKLGEEQTPGFERHVMPLLSKAG